MPPCICTIFLSALDIIISSSVFQIISNLDEIEDDMPDWEKELQAELQVMYFCKREKFISTIEMTNLCNIMSNKTFSSCDKSCFQIN